MLKHQPATIDGFVILAVPPVRIMFLVFATTATLFSVPMISLIIGIDDTLASVTPNYIEHRAL
jgi:hypothetical protein